MWKRSYLAATRCVRVEVALVDVAIWLVARTQRSHKNGVPSHLISSQEQKRERHQEQTLVERGEEGRRDEIDGGREGAGFIEGLRLCGGGGDERSRDPSNHPEWRCKQYCNSHQLFRIVVEWAVKWREMAQEAKESSGLGFYSLA